MLRGEHWYFFYFDEKGMLDAVPLVKNENVAPNQCRVRRKRCSTTVVAETTDGLPVVVPNGVFFSLERAVVCQPQAYLAECTIFAVHERGMKSGNNFLVTRNVQDLEQYIRTAYQQNKSLVLTIFTSLMRVPQKFTKIYIFGNGKERYSGTSTSKFAPLLQLMAEGVTSPSQNERAKQQLDAFLATLEE